MRISYVLLFFFLATMACVNIIPPAPEDNELLDGPIPGLNSSENQQFLQGDLAFNNEVFTPATGLGPTFVATSCASCHIGDGKGHPFTTLVRFGQTEPNVPADQSIGGPQLQNRSIPGYLPETLPLGAPFMKFTPPAVTGLGLLEALTDQQLLSNADPDDLDADGISGVPNYNSPPSFFKPKSSHIEVDGKYIGRFGKKAAAIDLLQQTVGAYNQDMGISTSFDPVDIYSGLVIDPEVSDNTVRNVVFYLQTLKTPQPRNQSDPQVVLGKSIFNEIKCSSCHIPQWTTPKNSIAALSERTFYPYTDLLLHDMGTGLDDGVTEGSAETFEWKTPALWGLGLSPNSQGGEYFLLHDGRARSIEEAILLHGGEAVASRNAFQGLSQENARALLKFLESL